MWEVDSFTPSDGRVVQYVTVDHTAWLKRSGDGRPTVHIALNISSRGVSEVEARQIVDMMVAGLNASQEAAAGVE